MKWMCSILVLVSVNCLADTYNITNYGGSGDCVNFYVNTVSNSLLVTTTNLCSTNDIGKYIEIESVGKPTYGVNSFGVTTNGNQDIIAIVTNVVNLTNLYVSVQNLNLATTNYQILASTTNTWATLGTDNTPAITNILYGVGNSDTNITVYIPNGRYLCMARKTGFTYTYNSYSIPLYRGGINFLGESRDGSVLIEREAWQSSGDKAASLRGFLFEVCMPVTNNYPLVFKNITLDGGVKRGNLPVHGITANTVDGLGWDEQHSAILYTDMLGKGTNLAATILTNTAVVHWRGESIKSINSEDEGSNYIDIQNCFFGDICASALNVYPRWSVFNNVFSNCWQLCEYYQKYYHGTSYFCGNLLTNYEANAGDGYFGNPFTINGGIATAPTMIVSNNLFYPDNYGYNVFVFTPAANVQVISNTVYGAGYTIAFNIGPSGSQGTDLNTNLLIAGNSYYVTDSKITGCVEFGGSGIHSLDGLTFTNNYFYSNVEIQNAILNYGGAYTNVIFENNTFEAPDTGFSIASTTSVYPLIATNNIYNPVLKYWTSGTNAITYSRGPFWKIVTYTPGVPVYLDDSHPLIIPSGALLSVTNAEMYGRDIPIYESAAMTSSMTLSNHQSTIFYWSGTAWELPGEAPMGIDPTYTPPPQFLFRSN